MNEHDKGPVMTDAEWLAERRTLLTATDAPAILGVHPYKSALQVYLEKTQGVDLTRGSKRMDGGLRFEELIAQTYAERTGRSVEAPARRLLRHPTIPFMGASLDRLTRDPQLGRMVLELKTTWQKLEDEPPLHWQVQIAHQMAVAQVRWASVAVLNLSWGYDFSWRDLERNDGFTEVLIRRLEHFWTEHVLKRVPPPPDGSESAGRALAALYSQPTDSVVELPPESAGWAREYRDAQAELKRCEARKAAAQNAICAAMGAATVGVAADGSRFTWRTEKRQGFAVAPKETRVFRASRSARAAEGGS